jgi:GT2 family glycosyltransferase/glycosyltransferase involved in cell wall biosynthesis
MIRNFYSASHAPYYIYALDYAQQSAGIRALHYFCHALNESGLEAYVSCKVTTPHLRTPILTDAVIKRHQAAGREPIVVYPEVIPGNPLSGNTVARWLLNRPGHLAGDKYFSDSDLLFFYDPNFLPAGMQGEILHIPTCDLSIFNNNDNPHDGARDLVCFYANKFLVKGGKLTCHAVNATSLCQDQKLTHAEIASILRRAKVLYVYEPTALITEALLCGCPVVLIQTDYLRANTNQDLHMPHCGFIIDDSPEAIAEAKTNVPNFRLFYEDNILKNAWVQLDRFIELTQAVARTRASSLPRQECEGQEELYQTDMENDSRYSSWRAARNEYAGMSLPDELEAGSTTPARQFHLIVPVPAQASERLSATIHSLSKQSHPHWRLTIVAQTPAPQEYQHGGNISWLHQGDSDFAKMANRLAAEDTDSEILVFLQAGDAIEPDALATIAREFTLHPDWRMAFTDQDQHADGMLASPFFKPDFSPDLFRSAPFSAEGMLAIRKEAFVELGGLSSEHSRAEFFDLMLRTYEQAGNDGIGHIQDVLHHQHSGGDQSESRAEHSAKKRALQEHFARTGIACDIEDGALPGTFRLRYHHNGEATATIVIPTLNGGAALQRCVSAVVDSTAYRNWELLIVDCGSNDADTLAFLDFLRDMNNDAVRVVVLQGASLPAALNAGASLSSQNYLVFLSDSTEPMQPDWLDEMLGYAAQPGVGVVGAKALGQDGNIAFAGYVLGLEGKPAAMHSLHAPQDSPGYFGRLQLPGNPSAVSSACMLTERALFVELGGFDEMALAGNYSDVDFCLRAGQSGRRVVWTPYALLRQEHLTAPPAPAENKPDDVARSFHLPAPEAQTMFDRWLDRIAFDPSYNRNLSLSAGAFEIETLPALTLAPDFRPAPRILAHTYDRAGSGGNRIISPLRTLLKAGKAQGLDSGDYLSIPDLARLSPDAVIFQRQMDWVQIKMMELYALNSKALRIFELDEVLVEIRQGNQTMAKRFRQALDICDRLVVPTEYLAEEYRQFKDDIRIAPNCLERARWESLAPKRRQGKKPRVGWAGSAVHESDLALVADVVRELGSEVEWVFFGSCPEGVRHLVEYHGSVPFDDYPAKLASLNLDLALAPLEDTPLNRGRSHLKLLEYGMLGYPVICSDIEPYRGDYPVTRVKNDAKSWENAIREHVADLDELARRGDALRDYVRANWMLEDHLDDWLKAWLPS